MKFFLRIIHFHVSLVTFQFWGAVAGAALGGLLGNKGSRDTNTANAQIASARNAFEEQEAAKSRDWSANESATNRQFTSAEAAMNRDFQERMSSTAIQRRMQDMKAGGINPILAGKFDASSPAGSAAAGSVGSTAKANSQGYTAENKMARTLEGMASAIQMSKALEEIKQVKALTAKTQAEGQLVASNIPQSKIKEGLWSPVQRDFQKISDWADEFQTNAKDGKYLDKLNQMLDNADDYVGEKIKSGFNKVKSVVPTIEPSTMNFDKQTKRNQTRKRNRSN